ncbi:hypothetical protein BV25DRAFT_1833913 [Artomyces pyxidatus]|uniref:Uncharacterized protein n=1 Tax=Artomyces pyxidatus TaxID=48021 RepID=A0ACB8TK23_9AGAM|nr:hypothetical protein BV25DRAFT_1833913 [Artomyces pyxidatus]
MAVTYMCSLCGANRTEHFLSNGKAGWCRTDDETVPRSPTLSANEVDTAIETTAYRRSPSTTPCSSEYGLLYISGDGTSPVISRHVSPDRTPTSSPQSRPLDIDFLASPESSPRSSKGEIRKDGRQQTVALSRYRAHPYKPVLPTMFVEGSSKSPLSSPRVGPVTVPLSASRSSRSHRSSSTLSPAQSTHADTGADTSPQALPEFGPQTLSSYLEQVRRLEEISYSSKQKAQITASMTPDKFASIEERVYEMLGLRRPSSVPLGSEDAATSTSAELQAEVDSWRRREDVANLMTAVLNHEIKIIENPDCSDDPAPPMTPQVIFYDKQQVEQSGDPCIPSSPKPPIETSGSDSLASSIPPNTPEDPGRLDAA